MKLITNTKLAIASALCAVVFTTAAQAQGVRVTVPFKFRAGSAVVPAGDYAVQVDRAHGRVTLGSLDGKNTLYVPVQNSFEGVSEKGSLTFHKYGDAYFLAKIKAPGATGYQMFTSAAEREARRTTGGSEIAMLEIPTR